MNKRFFLIAVLVILAVGFGWLLNSMTGKEGGTPQGGQGGHGGHGGPMDRTQAVSVLTLEPQTVVQTRSLPGRVSAFQQSLVRPQVSGLITARLFEEGKAVKKGQQLYQIDDARYEAALMSAKANLQSAQSNLEAVQAQAERYKGLVEIGAVSRQAYQDVQAELDQAKAAVAVAEADVAVAQVNFNYTKVYAPISGRIGRSLVTVGALVTASQTQPLAVITELDPVYVDMQESGLKVMELRDQGDKSDEIPVRIFLGNNNGRLYPLEGTLKFSEVTIDEMTGSVTLRALVPNPEGILLPGLFVHADLILGEKEALLVPQRAAIRAPDGSLMVWVVDQENTAHPRPVDVGPAYEDTWIVTSGLKAGERIIVEGYQKVRPDAVVEPSPWEKPSQS